MAEIVIPSVGVGMTEAVLLAWLKQTGDPVAADEPVAEIETDKATMELASPIAGTLGSQLYEPGAVIPVGTAIAVVEAEGAAAAGVAAAVAPTPDAAPEAAHAAVPAATVPAGDDDDRAPHALSPRARRLAAERREPEAAPVQAGAGRFRELIAAKVSEAWRTIPHFSVTREIDGEPMAAALEALRAAGTEPKPTITDLLLRAFAIGLRETGHERPGDIGLAVATPEGVVIPVVEGVLGLDNAGLASARAEAVGRARSGRLSVRDLQAAPASTLSNLGALGVDQFTGVIAVGQTSLLTVGRARPRAIVADDGRSLQLRTTFHATLNVDHRTYDGAVAARLLVAFADAAEGRLAVPSGGGK